MIYSKFLHSPLVQRKAGFSKELFGGDPNGFLHGLAYDEGKSWQTNRKRIGKQLHLGILESYIEVSFVLTMNQIFSCIRPLGFRLLYRYMDNLFKY